MCSVKRDARLVFTPAWPFCSNSGWSIYSASGLRGGYAVYSFAKRSSGPFAIVATRGLTVGSSMTFGYASLKG